MPEAPPGSGSAGATARHPPPAELVAIAGELAKVTDPLEGNALAHKALLASMADVLADEELSPRERRRELRTIAAAAKDLLPDARRWEVDQLIKADQRALEAKSRQRRGAKLEPVPQAERPALEVPPPPPDFAATYPAELAIPAAGTNSDDHEDMT